MKLGKWLVSVAIASVLAIGLTPAPPTLPPDPDEGGGCRTIQLLPGPGSYDYDALSIRYVQSTCLWLIADLVVVGDSDWNDFGGVIAVRASVYFKNNILFSGWGTVGLSITNDPTAEVDCTRDIYYYNPEDPNMMKLDCRVDRGDNNPHPVDFQEEVQVIRLTFDKAYQSLGYMNFHPEASPPPNPVISGGVRETLSTHGWGVDIKTWDF